MKPCHYDSMSESNGYYAKENESDRKRQHNLKHGIEKRKTHKMKTDP